MPNFKVEDADTLSSELLNKCVKKLPTPFLRDEWLPTLPKAELQDKDVRVMVLKRDSKAAHKLLCRLHIIRECDPLGPLNKKNWLAVCHQRFVECGGWPEGLVLDVSLSFNFDDGGGHFAFAPPPPLDQGADDADKERGSAYYWCSAMASPSKRIARGFITHTIFFHISKDRSETWEYIGSRHEHWIETYTTCRRNAHARTSKDVSDLRKTLEHAWHKTSKSGTHKEKHVYTHMTFLGKSFPVKTEPLTLNGFWKVMMNWDHDQAKAFHPKFKQYATPCKQWLREALEAMCSPMAFTPQDPPARMPSCTPRLPLEEGKADECSAADRGLGSSLYKQSTASDLSSDAASCKSMGDAVMERYVCPAGLPAANPGAKVTRVPGIRPPSVKSSKSKHAKEVVSKSVVPSATKSPANAAASSTDGAVATSAGGLSVDK